MLLPIDFIVVDSADDVARNERGKKAIEEANSIKADISQTRTLISATKSKYNYFNSTITPFNPEKDGDYEASKKSIKNIMFTAFLNKMPDAKIDSSTTETIIDGLIFDKFNINVLLDNGFRLNIFLLSKYYKGYDLGISYLYLDEKTKEQIEFILQSCEFAK